jgi:sulfite exporter TauE/SafE/copper chaperone CopZ
MTCAACRDKIERKLRNTAGVKSADVNYGAGIAVVTYDAHIVTQREIETVVEKLDYQILGDGQRLPNGTKSLGALIIVLAAYMLLGHFGLSDVFNLFPAAEIGMSYGALFLIGLLTSVHCVAMCGGINLSQCLPQKDISADNNGLRALRQSLLYNLGRIVSYTAVGGVVGALGAVITPTGVFRGAVALIAGVFMVVMGLNMLGIFPALRKFTPRLPQALTKAIGSGTEETRSPLVVGLLNGLMPCGPLQSMQIYALSTGGVASGALSMLLFGLGTVPLMFGIGAVSSVLSRKFARRATAAGAALVVVFGLSMFSQGWSLSGLPLVFLPGPAGVTVADGASSVTVADGYQFVGSTLLPGQYPAIAVQSGLPVKWTINAPQGSINGCNSRMIIREYGIEHKFTAGENVIEFTPDRTGQFSYSCWMGMIRGTITVTSNFE